MKILYGVCGIGNGHIFRQLPQILTYLKDGHQLVIFGYQESYLFFKKMESQYSNLKVLKVSVPYLVGNTEGLDLEESLRLEVNEQPHFQINTLAMLETKNAIGTPDLVVSDYEPIAAQYAYMTGATLHTFDQQSKFLFGDFPHEINGCTYADEIERLRLFFPKANKRIIASFFDFKMKAVPEGEEVTIVRPPMSERTMRIKAENGKYSCKKEVLIYLSPQLPHSQALSLVRRLFEYCTPWAREGYQFNCYLPRSLYAEVSKETTPLNIYTIGQPSYDEHLASCSGIISTAGHGLLSEAVYLNKRVLAISLDLYEQQLNGKMIEEMGAGIHTSIRNLKQNDLDRFLI